MKVQIINNPLHHIKTMKAKYKSSQNAEKVANETKKSSNGFLGNISYRKLDQSIHIATTRADYTDLIKWYTLKPDGTLITCSSNQQIPQDYKSYTTWLLYWRTIEKFDAAKGTMDNDAIENIVKEIETVINHK